MVFLSQYLTIYKDNEWCLRVLGSNKILAALPTEESKAAYVLRTVAAGLEEVGKAMGSSVGVTMRSCWRSADSSYRYSVHAPVTSNITSIFREDNFPLCLVT